jgi:ribonuclease Z
MINLQTKKKNNLFKSIKISCSFIIFEQLFFYLYNMEFSLRILGCNSAFPTSSDFSSAQVITYNSRPYLIDCAEGTQMLMRKYKVSFGKLKNIYISHLHGDHFFGLFGLLSSLSLLGRKQKLNIYAPKELKNIVDNLFNTCGVELNFELCYFDLEPSGKNLISSDKYLNVFSFPVMHSKQTFGFIFEEQKQDLNIKKEYIKKLNLKVSDILLIKRGDDYIDNSGEVYSNSELTIKPPNSIKYVYCSDTKKVDGIEKYFFNANVLYHEATFSNADKELAKSTFHSTTIDAGETARKTKTKLLIIGHFSSRYKDRSILLRETQKIFPNTLLAYEGMFISI